jgi:DNA-binding ferritin-like protein
MLTVIGADMDKHDRLEFLMQSQSEKMDFLVDRVVTLGELPVQIERLQGDVTELKSDMQIVKSDLREHSADISELKGKAHSY